MNHAEGAIFFLQSKVYRCFHNCCLFRPFRTKLTMVSPLNRRHAVAIHSTMDTPSVRDVRKQFQSRITYYEASCSKLLDTRASERVNERSRTRGLSIHRCSHICLYWLWASGQTSLSFPLTFLLDDARASALLSLIMMANPRLSRFRADFVETRQGFQLDRARR